VAAVAAKLAALHGGEACSGWLAAAGMAAHDVAKLVASAKPKTAPSASSDRLKEWRRQQMLAAKQQQQQQQAGGGAAEGEVVADVVVVAAGGGGAKGAVNGKGGGP
jgi:hypothetical protein